MIPSSYGSVFDWSGAISYYTGDNTTNDSIGSNNGTLINGSTYGSGKINNSFQFDGVDDYVDLGLNKFNLVGDFSISLWVKRITDGGIQNIFCNYNYTGVFFGFQLVFFGNNCIFQHYNGGGNTLGRVDSNTILLNVFTHIVVTRVNGSNTKIYTNGVLSQTNNTSINPVYHSTTNNSTLGTQKNGSIPYYFLNGCIDELSVWEKTLTADDVTSLYNSGAGRQYPN